MRAFSRPLIASIAAAAIIAGCGSGTSNTAQPKTSNSYQFSPQEKAVLRVLVFDDLHTLSAGGDATSIAKSIIPDYVVVNSNQLQTEYEKNEVAGDLKFRKKIIFLTGKVTSIDRSIGENYFLKLKGGSNMFIQPQASMADGYTKFLAGLSKGNTVLLACIGNGMTMGSAIASSCEPLYNYLDKVAGKYTQKLEWASIASGTNEDLKHLAFVSVVVAPHLNPNGACHFDNYDSKKCGAEFEAISKKDGMQAEADATRSKLGLKPREPATNSPTASAKK